VQRSMPPMVTCQCTSHQSSTTHHAQVITCRTPSPLVSTPWPYRISISIYWATRTLLKPKRCYMTSMISYVTTRHRLNGSVYHPQFMKVPDSGASDGETSGYVRADATHHFCWADDCGSMREHECCGASCMPKRAKESPTPSMTGIDSRKIKELRRLLKAK